MRFHLRTLILATTILPPLLAALWRFQGVAKAITLIVLLNALAALLIAATSVFAVIAMIYVLEAAASLLRRITN